jgi:murein DD-endopeptidase MepM/ murein hydrolase activator NlpD
VPLAAVAAEPRVVARIIDPSVREDGLGEPVFITRPERSRNGAAGSEAGGPANHPVRERLLAKARAAQEARGLSAKVEEPSAPALVAAPLAGAPHDPEPAGPNAAVIRSEAAPEPYGFSAVPDLADDLDLIGAPERRRAPPAPSAPPLGASASLLLGTLSGMAALAVAFAILIQVDPRSPVSAVSRSPLVQAAALAASSPATPAPVSRLKRPDRQAVPAPWRIGAADDETEPGTRRVVSTVGDRAFLAALSAAGVSLREGYRVIRAFSGVRNFDKCRPRDQWSALVDVDSGRLRAFEYRVSDEEVYQAREGKDGLLSGQRLDMKVKRERSEGVIVVRGTFEEAATEAGFEPGLAQVVNKALAGYSSVGEMRDGDVLGLIVQEISVLGAFSRYAGIEALEYRPVGGEPVRIYYHATEKTRGYVDSKGRVFGKSRWARPVPGAAVTSRFNPRRRHPILKIIKPHNGTDFGAPTGTPVLASSNGRISFIGEAGPNGNLITVRHTGGYETGYSHLSRFAKGLKVGARVEQKQLIGYVGSTGRSTGPHLHFSAKKAGRFIDPESLNLDAFSRVGATDREALAELRRRYDRLLEALRIPQPQPLAPSAPAVALLQDGAELEPPQASPGAPSTGASATTGAAATGTAATGAARLALRAQPSPDNVKLASLASIYLSDQELMRQQPQSHSGEVDP